MWIEKKRGSGTGPRGIIKVTRRNQKMRMNWKSLGVGRNPGECGIPHAKWLELQEASDQLCQMLQISQLVRLDEN